MVFRQWRWIRFQRTVVAGQFQTGEAGIPDFMAVRYLDDSGVVVAFWAELKRSHGGRLNEDQEKWQARERARGAIVVNVKNIAEFDEWYTKQFGWLHTDWEGRKGQEMLPLEGETW